MKPYGEVVSRPFEVCHVEKELSELTSMLLRLNDDIRVVMEATGIYHLPVLSYLKEKGLFVAVINPFEMKEYRCQGLRRVKTDKQDAITISNYGIDHWYRLKNYEAEDSVYAELKLFGKAVPSLYADACGECFGTDSSSGLYDAWDQNAAERLVMKQMGKISWGILRKNTGIMTISRRNRRNSL